jgi:hypothetical protein
MCVMDYAVKIWWEDHDVVRDAIRDGDPSPIEDVVTAQSLTLPGHGYQLFAAEGDMAGEPSGSGGLPSRR